MALSQCWNIASTRQSGIVGSCHVPGCIDIRNVCPQLIVDRYITVIERYPASRKKARRGRNPYRYNNVVAGQALPGDRFRFLNMRRAV